MRLSLARVLVSVCLLCCCFAVGVTTEVRFEVKVTHDKRGKNIFTITNPVPDDIIAAAPQEIPTLIGQLIGKGNVLEQRAVLRLIKSGDVAVPALSVATASLNIEQRHAAVICLALINTRASRDALHRTAPWPFITALLNGEDITVNALTLTLIGGKDALAAVRPFLAEGKDPTTQYYIMTGIVYGRYRELLPEVTTCLRSPDATMRATAAMAYLAILDEKATDTLIAMLPDPDEHVRGMLVIYLSGMTHTQRVRDALVTLMLFDPVPEIRATATGVLIAPPNTGLIPYFIRAAKDTDAKVRQGAALALGKFPTNPAVRTTLEALKEDADTSVREEAVRQLEKK